MSKSCLSRDCAKSGTRKAKTHRGEPKYSQKTIPEKGKGMATSSGRIGLYPGTFDPITNGHMDIITRAATHMVAQPIIAVARNAGKGPLFGVEDRVPVGLEEVAPLPPAAKASFTVAPFHDLPWDFAAQMGATL